VLHQVGVSVDFPDDGLRKPKHVGTNSIILNDFSSLTFLQELFALVGQIKNSIRWL